MVPVEVLYRWPFRENGYLGYKSKKRPYKSEHFGKKNNLFHIQTCFLFSILQNKETFTNENRFTD